MAGMEGRLATAGSDGPGLLLGTEASGSAFGTKTSLAPLASSPQWGQNLWPFRTEAQPRWKRWEMLPYGRHSMNEP